MTSPATSLHRGEFQNEPFIDFSKAENAKAMQDALRQVKGMFGREYPLTIGGEKITTVDKIRSHNPSHPADIIGIFQKANVDMANKAVEAAHRAFDRWKRVPAEERVACAYRAADILRRRARTRSLSVMIFPSGHALRWPGSADCRGIGLITRSWRCCVA